MQIDMSGHYVYILLCSDGTLYTGWTVELKERLSQHLCGKASKYTRSRLPVRLVYFEKTVDRSSAMRREAAIKKMGRGGKDKLITNAFPHRKGYPLDKLSLEVIPMTHTINDDCVSCGACAPECPVNAISEGSDKYHIDPEICIDCGACADVCPVGAPRPEGDQK